MLRAALLIVLLSAATGLVLAAGEIPDKDLGLSRTSVFDTPQPEAYGFDGTAPSIAPMTALDVMLNRDLLVAQFKSRKTSWCSAPSTT